MLDLGFSSGNTLNQVPDPYVNLPWLLFQSQGYGDDYTAKINKEGQVEAAKLNQALEQNQGKVVDWLLDLVSDIKPEVG